VYVGHCLCTCSYTECIVRSKMVNGTRSVYIRHCLSICSYTECIVRSKMVKGIRSVTLRTDVLTPRNYSISDEKYYPRGGIKNQ